MAGGLLAASREYFFEIGGYGKNFNIIEFCNKNFYVFFAFCFLDDDMEVKFVDFYFIRRLIDEKFYFRYSKYDVKRIRVLFCKITKIISRRRLFKECLLDT